MMYKTSLIALAATLSASSAAGRSQITFNGGDPLISDRIGSAIESIAVGPWGTVRKQITSQIKGWTSEGVRKFDNIIQDGHDCKQ